MRKLLLILPILLLGCKSTPKVEEPIGTSLLGVVYDGQSNPVLNAEVLISDMEDQLLRKAKTDINGKFYIDELPFAEYKVLVKAEKCIDSELVINHFDIENVLIVKVKTFEDMVATLEEYLKSSDWENVEELFSELESIDPEDIYTKYLKAIYFVKTDRNDEAIEILAPLKKLNYKYINILLEDINGKVN